MIFHSDVTLTHIDHHGRYAFGVCNLDGQSVYINKGLVRFLDIGDAEEGDTFEMRLKENPESPHREGCIYEALGVVNDEVEGAARSFLELEEKTNDLRRRLAAAHQRIRELEDLDISDQN